MKVLATIRKNLSFKQSLYEGYLQELVKTRVHSSLPSANCRNKANDRVRVHPQHIFRIELRVGMIESVARNI